MNNFLEQAPPEPKQHWFKSSWLIMPLVIILIGSIIFVGQKLIKSDGQVQGEKIVSPVKLVKTMVLSPD
ncbi:MAG: hypothetical protein AAB740_04060, partial [Patescibacteria group bacterium]